MVDDTPAPGLRHVDYGNSATSPPCGAVVAWWEASPPRIATPFGERRGVLRAPLSTPHPLRASQGASTEARKG